MANFDHLAKRLRIRAKYVTKNSDELVRRVTLAVVEKLVETTPVKTGRAVTNWRTLLYRPDNVLYPQPSRPVNPEAARQRTLDEARQTVDAYTGGRRSMWITNNVSYIRDLNRGSSTQAPPGFVELALQAGREAVLNARPVLTEVEL